MENTTSYLMARRGPEIRKAFAKYLHPLKLSARVDDLSNQYNDSLLIDFDTRAAKAAGFDFAGLQIIYSEGVFEFSEYQAGDQQNELHIFGYYRTIGAALRRVLKGKPKPIHIWK